MSSARRARALALFEGVDSALAQGAGTAGAARLQGLVRMTDPRPQAQDRVNP